MDDFAGLASSERREIIAEAAIGMEREFTLRSLFSLPSGHAAMVIEGGTSLSKFERLRRDYRAMRMMFLGEPATFEDVLRNLRTLQQLVSAL